MVAHHETLTYPGGAEENHETLKQRSWSLKPVVDDEKQESYPLDPKVRASMHGVGRKVCQPLSIVVTLVGLSRCELRTSCKRKGPQNMTKPR